MKIFRQFEDISPDSNTSVALGLFDGVHRGHQAVLNRTLLSNPSLEPCVFTYTIEKEIPYIKSDFSILTTNEYKFHLFDEMGFAYVVAPEFSKFKDLTPKQFVEDKLIGCLHAKEITCGSDFTFGSHASGGVDDLISLAAPFGVKVNIEPPVLLDGERISSTIIRKEILSGNMENTSLLLGRRFSIHFKVEHGNQIGRLIQFPTINQIFPNKHIVPKYGVYATTVVVDGQIFGGVTNVGVKPTVGSDYPLAETFIIDFSGNLYGLKVEVFFFDFIRPETKFPSIDELKTQIAIDTAAVKKMTENNIIKTKSEFFKK